MAAKKSPHQIVMWALAKLKPYSGNARQHPPKQIRQLRRSLRRFGFTVPILARSDGTVIAGHGRLLAAKAERLTEVPVIIADGWTEAQCRAYGLVDNKLALTSSWDAGRLAAELDDLDLNSGIDLASFGFPSKADELDDEDDGVPELEEALSYAVIVRLKSEEEQTQLLARLEKEGLECEAMIS